MIPLADVNVLMALVWEAHVHHAIARRWFTALGGGPWATTGLTQAGFVRVSSNPVVIPEAISVQQAIVTLRQLLIIGEHRLLGDDAGFVDNPLVPHERLVGHRQVTDAQLVAIARSHDAQLVTLDRGVEALAPDEVLRLTS